MSTFMGTTIFILFNTPFFFKGFITWIQKSIPAIFTWSNVSYCCNRFFINEPNTKITSIISPVEEENPPQTWLVSAEQGLLHCSWGSGTRSCKGKVSKHEHNSPEWRNPNLFCFPLHMAKHLLGIIPFEILIPNESTDLLFLSYIIFLNNLFDKLKRYTI